MVFDGRKCYALAVPHGHNMDNCTASMHRQWGWGHTDSAPNVAAKIGHSDIHLDSAAEVECAEAECVEALSAATGWSVTLLLEG